MDSSAAWILDLFVQVGPGVVFLLAFLETVFVTGLVMPTGPAIILTTLLAGAVEGYGVATVITAAMAGGALGDSGGFWIGRRFGRGALRAEGVLARAAKRHLPRAVSLSSRHPVVGVTFARMVSFVRTLTPQLAGMSRLTYPRFLAYDLPGVAAWAAMYVGVALVAGESWRVVSRWIGTVWAVVFLTAIVVLWLLSRSTPPSPTRESGGSPLEPPEGGEPC